MNSRSPSKLCICSLALLFAAILLLFASSCGSQGGGSSGSQGSGSQTGGQQSQPQAQPDLTISAIQVYPQQPQAGQKFTVNIYVKNAGNAASGQYDLAISILDNDRGSTYPVGTFRYDPLQPGEDVAVYSDGNRLVNDPGNYQVNVEIQPFNFTDGDSNNNSWSKPFSAR